METVCIIKEQRSNWYICRKGAVMLTWYVDKGCLYSGLYGAKSAVSSVVCIKGFSKLSDHPMISRYLKRMFNRHLPLRKYTQIWDINQILDYYTNLPDNEELD